MLKGGGEESEAVGGVGERFACEACRVFWSFTKLLVISP